MATKVRTNEAGAQKTSGTVGERIAEQRTNMDYLRDHYDELLKKYPNHWVIVDAGKVINAESDAKQLIESIGKTSSSNSTLYYLANPEKRMFL